MPLRPIPAALACVCTAALLACIPAAGGDPVAGVSAVPPAASPGLPAGPVRTNAEIAGQWDIVSFQGYAPRRRLQGTTRAAIADFRDGRVALRIECNGSGVTGEVRDGRFWARPGDRIQTLMGCGPVKEARDAALFGFFDRNPTVERLGEGRLRLTAGRDVLLLERPATRRLAFLPTPQQLLGEWRLVEIVRYDAEGGIVGVGLSDVDARVTFDGITAAVAPCPGSEIPYRYTKDGRIENSASTRVAGACPALSAERFGQGAPATVDVLAVLHAGPAVELVDEDTILLSTETYGLLLTKRADR